MSVPTPTELAQLVVDELYEAQRTHKSMNSLHEGYAVLLEEVDEFWDWVKKKDRKRDFNEILKELIQISAMAQRVALEVVLPRLIKDKT